MPTSLRSHTEKKEPLTGRDASSSILGSEEGGAPHIIKVSKIKILRGKNKNSALKLGQWVFDVELSKIDWQPLSAAVCESGMIALYPVRKVDLVLKRNALMHTIVGVRSMKPNIHYVLLEGAGLTGLNWRVSAIDRR